MAATSKHRPKPTRPAQRLQAPRWARVQRVQLIRREIREYLPPGAVEVLFAVAEHVVEGSAELTTRGGDPGGKRVFATVMVTIDLRACSAYFREPTDEATAQRVAELVQQSARVRTKLIDLARPELARLAGDPPEALDVTLDHVARAEGTRILIDGDAMGWRGGARRR